MDLELARTLILVVGWPILVIGSILMLRATRIFYQSTRKTAFGKLVLVMMLGQVASMFVIAVVSTAFLRADLARGVAVVLPVFGTWFVIFLIVARVVVNLGREAIEVNKIYQNLDVQVKERTQELESTNSKLAEQSKKNATHVVELEKINRMMVDRELKMVELKDELAALKERTSTEDGPR